MTTMHRILATGLLAAGALGLASTAQARNDVYWSVGVGGPACLLASATRPRITRRHRFITSRRRSTSPPRCITSRHPCMCGRARCITGRRLITTARRATAVTVATVTMGTATVTAAGAD